MPTSTLVTLFMQLFLPAMHPTHPLAPVCRVMQGLTDPEQRSQALLMLASGQGATTQLQQATALLLLSEENQAQDALESLLHDAAHQLQSTLRFAHVLLACLLCEQGKPEASLAHWQAGLEHRFFLSKEAAMQRMGFHPGLALLCRCIAHTLLAPSEEASADCQGALVWEAGDPSLLLLQAVNAHALGDDEEARHTLRLADIQMQSHAMPLPPHGADIPPYLLAPTLIAWMGKRHSMMLLQRYDDVIEWLEDTQRDSEEKAALQSPLQKERALLRVLLAQQIHARLRTLQGRLRAS